MAMDDLTPTNFISKIKAMDPRERGKLQIKKLIDLICQVDDEGPSLAAQIEELRNSVEHVNQTSSVNRSEIIALKAQNDDYVKKNAALRIEVDLLKLHAQECKDRDRAAPQPAQNLVPNVNAQIDTLRTETNAQFDIFRKEITELHREVNSIQQYLRINNLEIVGLPEPNPGESEETLLVNALNSLEGIDNPINPEDIDISHPLNSNRRDEKSVHVIRFISRKTKNTILTAKKQDANKQFKFRDRDIYINEHLSKYNRGLFAAAQEKKRALDYKFCWTRGGVVNMRKTETSQVITISSIDDLAALV